MSTIGGSRGVPAARQHPDEYRAAVAALARLVGPDAAAAAVGVSVARVRRWTRDVVADPYLSAVADRYSADVWQIVAGRVAETRAAQLRALAATARLAADAATEARLALRGGTDPERLRELVPVVTQLVREVRLAYGSATESDLAAAAVRARVAPADRVDAPAPRVEGEPPTVVDVLGGALPPGDREPS